MHYYSILAHFDDNILGDLISNVESKTCPEGFWLNNFGPLVENRVKTVEKIFLLSKFVEALFMGMRIF